jgi:aspartate ammonia-lyase|tara:strand:+ start:2841 stop:3017 length:177 start_codon:yes stop_codon:yes gene_type:complete
VNGSIGIVTNLLPVLGYKKATAVAKEALATGVPVSVVALQYLDDATVRKALDPKTMIR